MVSSVLHSLTYMHGSEKMCSRKDKQKNCTYLEIKKKKELMCQRKIIMKSENTYVGSSKIVLQGNYTVSSPLENKKVSKLMN